MRKHSDQEIINKALAQEKSAEEIRDNKIDVAVDFDDEHGIMHTYVVTFEKDLSAEDGWRFLEINELSSW